MRDRCLSAFALLSFVGAGLVQVWLSLKLGTTDLPQLTDCLLMDVAALLLVRGAVLDLGAMGSERDLAGLHWPVCLAHHESQGPFGPCLVGHWARITVSKARSAGAVLDPLPSTYVCGGCPVVV